MARTTTRSTVTAALQQPLQRKRKRNSSPGQTTVSKLQKTDDNDHIHHDVFLPEQDAQKILEILELKDTQGLLDRVFPSPNAPDALVSLRTLLKHPTEHPLPTIKSAVTNLHPISSLPRSRPSTAASQQLAFANLAHTLIEQASRNAISPPLDVESILETVNEEETPPSKPAATDVRRKYALVQHLPQGDYWTSLSSEASAAALKQLPTGHAELVAILPSSSSTSVDSVPTLGSVSSRPLGPTKKIAGQRRVTTGGFLDYGPFASFAPCFDHNGEVVGQRQLAEVIYQQEVKRRLVEEELREEREGKGSITVVVEDVVMNGEEPTSPDVPKQSMDAEEDMESLLPPEEVQAIKEAMGSLELENAVQELLERNQRALVRLKELQRRRFSQGGANFSAVEEGSEEWETAQCIMDSLATLASLRPRSSDSDGAPLIPPPSVLRRLQRSLALEPTAGWYGNLPAAKATALHDDSTIKVKSPTVAPATSAPTPAPAAPAATTTAPPAAPAAYSSYGYNYGAQQQQAYRPAAAYSTFKPGQTSGYYQYGVANNATQQSYYNQSYAGGSNQQPYGSTAQTYPAYQGWYTQPFQSQGTAPAKTGTPTPAATTSAYGAFYNPGATVNGTPRPAVVANTVASNKATPVAQPMQPAGTWSGYQPQGVAPTLPSHLRTNQPYQNQFYQAYQAQTATPPAR
ncbi:hypothetical protein CC1G_03759 [Coprinopsis cinerea okayama7|uniref:Uncharacterized protein n=1 Tax=Coprinopsis cinerea (strain Okayama-7 / 130 / ATCC MYA-4618 / FGSC 9003) TaxID=240176 RepID=A8N252_COPC7|nr:hypothetical protein CC1G_03759 [Coprinopsis cinerea okayama7\|eukprot:XP_001828965.1 hypothetical protein CC1G_03759 [Coprinopsis cinerea okayama7\